MNKYSDIGTMRTWLAGLFCLLAGFAAAPLLAAEADLATDRDIHSYYRITDESLAVLPDQIVIESQGMRDDIPPVLELEGFITQLSRQDYSGILRDYVRSLDPDVFASLVETEFSLLFDLYIESIGEQEFADIYRQFLGELTSDYLTTAANQDFTQYVLSRILQLSSDGYSSLYRNYILTLWRYYVQSTPVEQLQELLGDDFAELTAMENLVILDEAYFDLLTEHLASIDENEFIRNYRSYVTEMIGGLIREFSVDETESGFTELTVNESLGLLRRHIASIGKDYFIEPFRQSLSNNASRYVNAASDEQLAVLAAMPAVTPLIENRLAAYNNSVQARTATLDALIEAGLVTAVIDELRFVANIPYPNLRLLRIAVNHALRSFAEGSAGEGGRLDQAQFNILMAATMNTVMEYDLAGPVSATQAEAGEDNDAAVASGSGSITWDFLGCGCEIEREKVIYGFYPTWYVPQPGAPAQEIDFRFYDRVAYFGLTLDQNGRISDDDYWRQGGAMNDFIQGAHVRDTRIDLAIYSPTWYEWGDASMNIAATNIVNKLTIPLQFSFFERFASSYLVPVYPTRSESVGKTTMGDGLTLYFDNIEDPETGEVRDLEMIERMVLQLTNLLKREFGDIPMPINLMLDYRTENTEAVLQQLSNLIVGTPESPHEYVARVLVFLEQETWDTSQVLMNAIRTVFQNDDTAMVFQKFNPILIPAMDEPNHFASLERDLLDLRWIYGTRGGAAIWPLPLQSLEEDILIEEAFRSAMVEENPGVWQDFQGWSRRVYFRARLAMIFAVTSLFLLSLMVFAYSIREPVKPWILWLTKVIGAASFFLFIFSAIFIDPYLNPWRIVFFVGAVILIMLIPFQPAVPERGMQFTENRFVKRQVKRQQSRFVRRFRSAFRKGLWRRNAD